MGKLKWIRYASYVIEILVVFMVQETPGLIPELFGARPVLLIPVALSIALFEGERPSMMFGLFSGLLIDFGIGGALGFHALLLAATCFFLSVLATDLIHTNFLTAMLITIVVSCAVLLLQWLFYFVFAGYEGAFYALTAHFIPRFVYTVVPAPVIYYFNRALAFQIRAEED